MARSSVSSNGDCGHEPPPGSGPGAAPYLRCARTAAMGWGREVTGRGTEVNLARVMLPSGRLLEGSHGWLPTSAHAKAALGSLTGALEKYRSTCALCGEVGVGGQSGMGGEGVGSGGGGGEAGQQRVCGGTTLVAVQ